MWKGAIAWKKVPTMIQTLGNVLMRHKSKAETDYGRLIRSEVYALWSGVTDMFTFVDNLSTLTYRFLTEAWNEGMKECGIAPEEMTPGERFALVQVLTEQYTYIVSYGNDIVNGSKVNGGKLTPLNKRAQMWANRYQATRSQAMQMACGDKKLRWVVNPLKEHCSSCLKLDGRVYRASIWQKYDIRPRDVRPGHLICKGFRCGCELIVTTDKVTPGRPPNMP